MRRDQGLCYHCDDKWSPGHRCKSRLHLLIADEDVLSPDSPSDDDPNPTLVSQISLNAMEGSPTPQTFRLYGSIGHHRVIILVDGGSSHNFIQTRIARFLNLPTTPTSPLRVMVGNGHTLDCDTVSPQITLRQALMADAQYQELLHKIQTTPAAHPGLSIRNGLILKDNRIWIPFPTPSHPHCLRNSIPLPSEGTPELQKPSTASATVLTGPPSKRMFSVLCPIAQSANKPNTKRRSPLVCCNLCLSRQGFGKICPLISLPAYHHHRAILSLWL